MTFREKARNLFRPRSTTASSASSTTSSTSSLHHTSTHDTLASVANSLSRWPSNVYTTAEAQARLKYRGTPKPEHTALLHSFQFSPEAWDSSSAFAAGDRRRRSRRRNSGASQYSPMGTRAPSRRNSVASLVEEGAAGGSRSVDSFETGEGAAGETSSNAS